MNWSFLRTERSVGTLAFALLAPLAHAASTVTPGPWERYYNNTLQQSGFDDEAACLESTTALNITRTYTCRTRTTVAVTTVTTPPPPPPPPATGTGHSYTTSFPLSEKPISEGGVWGRAANAWQQAETIGGLAISAGYTESEDDGYSTIQNFPDNNYEVIATVNADPVQSGGETEILLRVTDTATSVKAYECLYGNKSGGWAIVRWNGPKSNITFLGSGTAPSAPNNAQIKCSIVGSTLTFAWRASASGNWTTLKTLTDGTHATGKPGMAFYTHQAEGNRLSVGFRSFTVNSLQ